MVRFRRWCSDRKKVILAAGVAGLVVLILQKYALNTQTSTHQNHREYLNRIQKLKEMYWAVAGTEGNKSTEAMNQTLLQVKTVLMHSFPHYYEFKSGPGVFLKCDYPCTLTLDSELEEEVESVIVYSQSFKPHLTKKRSPGQIWAFFAVESPVNYRNAVFRQAEWKSRFNWTVTYRRDSDMYFGYGDVVKAHSPEPRKNLSAVVASKSKMVAWFVSNCKTQSRRAEFVQVLKEFIKVDVYGKCGTLKCGEQGNKSCMNMLSRDYYFYLAFENSLCGDYLTEKLYRTMKLIDIIPVVRGGANYTSLLPPHSYIDASQFPSVKALADHLKQVAADRQLYESYLAWKNEWRVIEPFPFPFCEFCQRLHHKDRWARVYPDIDSWWMDGQCHAPPTVVQS